MNIMMVSVTERTRRSAPARRRRPGGGDPDAVHHRESVILCLIGGIAGILLGLALGAGLSKAVATPPARA